MHAPVVSVIIPTYRHAEFVEETLASVFAQTFTDYEVIVVNDGSPDDTAARLRPLAQAGRIRYLEQANAGQAAARNRGLAEARGEFVAYLDDDDLWPPGKLSWQVAALREHPAWVMVSGLSGEIAADGRRVESPWVNGTVEIQSTPELFQGGGIDSPGQVLVRRSALEAVRGFDPALWGSDDVDLWIRLSTRGEVGRILQMALYYRRHATNASNAAGRMFWNAVRMVRKNLPLLPRDQRRETWCNALHAVYIYSGKRVMNAARRGGWRDRWAAGRVLAYLFPTMLRDGTLARLVYSDLAPAWVLALRRRL